MFLHGGFWHLFANIFILYFFGSSLSQFVGEKKFLLVYFIGGILGGLFYLLLGPINIPAVGASGAVFSVAGALMVLSPKSKIFIIPFPIPIPIWAWGILSFLIIAPGIAWQAHLGGLIFGLIAGLLFRRRQHYGYTIR